MDLMVRLNEHILHHLILQFILTVSENAFHEAIASPPLGQRFRISKFSGCIKFCSMLAGTSALQDQDASESWQLEEKGRVSLCLRDILNSFISLASVSEPSTVEFQEGHGDAQASLQSVLSACVDAGDKLPVGASVLTGWVLWTAGSPQSSQKEVPPLGRILRRDEPLGRHDPCPYTKTPTPLPS